MLSDELKKILFIYFIYLTQNSDRHKGRKNHANMCPEIEK